MFKWLVGLALLGLLAIPLWSVGSQRSLAELYFFDVGQGDSTLLQAGRWQLLVDAGPDQAAAHHLGEAVPVGDTQIEVAILTHQHADHYRGLRAVLAHYRIERLLVAPGEGDAEYQQVLQAAVGAGSHIEQLDEPVAVPAPTGISITVRPPLGVSSNPNDRSLVTFIGVGSTKVLLTGDAEVAEERELLREPDRLAADIYKAGHHGSRTSSTPELLAAVRPRVTVISCGQRNRYGHPAASTVANLRRTGSQLYRTDQNGTVRVRFMADAFRITTER